MDPTRRLPTCRGRGALDEPAGNGRPPTRTEPRNVVVAKRSGWSSSLQPAHGQQAEQEPEETRRRRHPPETQVEAGTHRASCRREKEPNRDQPRPEQGQIQRRADRRANASHASLIRGLEWVAPGDPSDRRAALDPADNPTPALPGRTRPPDWRSPASRPVAPEDGQSSPRSARAPLGAQQFPSPARASRLRSPQTIARIADDGDRPAFKPRPAPSSVEPWPMICRSRSSEICGELGTSATENLDDRLPLRRPAPRRASRCPSAPSRRIRGCPRLSKPTISALIRTKSRTSGTRITGTGADRRRASQRPFGAWRP